MPGRVFTDVVVPMAVLYAMVYLGNVVYGERIGAYVGASLGISVVVAYYGRGLCS